MTSRPATVTVTELAAAGGVDSQAPTSEEVLTAFLAESSSDDVMLACERQAALAATPSTHRLDGGWLVVPAESGDFTSFPRGVFGAVRSLGRMSRSGVHR